MSQSVNLGQLFQTAHEEGDLSAQSLAVLNVQDVGTMIQAGLGTPVLHVKHSDLFLVATMPDDSSSIAAARNTQAVIDGHNGVIDALKGSQQANSILLHTMLLNGRIVNEWGLLENARLLSRSNYDPVHGTPLYDGSVVLLGSVLAKAQEAKANGQVARTATLLVTDGEDRHSTRHTERDVAALVRDMLGMETHIVAGMDIQGGRVDCREVLRSMGIEDRWILSVGGNPTDIRRAFQLFSSSATQASQGAASFSKTALGGFAN